MISSSSVSLTSHDWKQNLWTWLVLLWFPGVLKWLDLSLQCNSILVLTRTWQVVWFLFPLKTFENPCPSWPQAHAEQLLLISWSSESSWQTGSHFLHLTTHPSFSAEHCKLPFHIQTTLSKAPNFPSLAADLYWIHFLIQGIPNWMPLTSPHIVDLQWWNDVSTTFGISVVIANHWAIWK